MAFPVEPAAINGVVDQVVDGATGGEHRVERQLWFWPTERMTALLLQLFQPDLGLGLPGLTKLSEKDR